MFDPYCLHQDGTLIWDSFPSILMPALYEHSDPKKVKIDFSTPLGVPNNETGIPQPGIQHHHGRPPQDGMRDIGPAGAGKRVLLLRGLDYHASSTDVLRRLAQEIARMLGKVGREKEAEKAVCRSVVMIDRAGRSSWGFGFVELATADVSCPSPDVATQLIGYQLASALLPWLLSPASQPQGFCINQRPVAASFVNPGTFILTPAGPLGGEFLLRSCRNGGFGSDTIDKPDGQWCSYWHQDAGASTVIPKGASAVLDNGDLEPLSTELRIFLGSLAMPSQQMSDNVDTKKDSAMSMNMPVGPISISMTGIQPIKIGAGKGVKLDEGLLPVSASSLFETDEEVEERDTVLLSRSEFTAVIPGLGLSQPSCTHDRYLVSQSVPLLRIVAQGADRSLTTPPLPAFHVCKEGLYLPSLVSFHGRQLKQYSERRGQYHRSKQSEGKERLQPLSSIIGISSHDFPHSQIAKDISKWNTKKVELKVPKAKDPAAPPKGLSDANAVLGQRVPAQPVIFFLDLALSDMMLTSFVSPRLHQAQNRYRSQWKSLITPIPPRSQVPAKSLVYCVNGNSRRKIRYGNMSLNRIFTRLALFS